MIFRSIASGSSGNCIYAGNRDTHILIDAGISGKRIVEALADMNVDAASLDGVFITHEHSDHIQGVGVLAKKYGVPIYGTVETISAMLHGKSNVRVPEEKLNYIYPNKSIEIKDLRIEPFSISHDAANPVSYCIYSENCKVGMATDLGEFSEYTLEKLQGSNILYIEANHDRNMLLVGRYPYYLKQRILGPKGHLSNDDTARLICSMKDNLPEHIVLAHLSKENNYPDLAYETVRYEVERVAEEGRMPELFVAPRDCPSHIITI